MERTIGEIFEYNGKWYQCVKSSDCPKCDLKHLHNCNHHFHCSTLTRKDGEEVIFKKLEKVGEPVTVKSRTFQKLTSDNNSCKECVFNVSNKACCKNSYIEGICDDNGFWTEIKNKEDMKTVKISKEDLDFLINKIRYGILPKHIDYNKIINEVSKLFSVDDTKHSNSENIGKNLKPFDLQAAKSGKPVCTRDGRKARIICFDMNANSPIVALVDYNGQEVVVCCHNDGRNYHAETTYNDLMMLSERKEGWVNVYKETSGEYYMDKLIHKTEKFAFDVACPDDYIGTVKIEWYE